MDFEEASVVFFAAPLRNTGLLVEEAIPAATAAHVAHLFLVLLILISPIQLLHPLDFPPNLSHIILVLEVEHGPDEILVALDPIPASLSPYDVLAPPELLPAPDPM